jgi:hypothetical protein
MKKIALALVLAFGLAGCAGTPLEQAVNVLTASVQNPVDNTNIYQVQNTYAAALRLTVEYRRYCWAKPYRDLLVDPITKSICEHRRQVVRTAQKYRKDARLAIDEAEQFITNNPTLNASAVVQAAWRAVQVYQNSIPAK